MAVKADRARRLEDIAKHCGVSISSVSRVLNNEPGVSAETRKRILAVAGRHDFRPRSRKRHLSRSVLDLLVVIPEEEELSANPFLNIAEILGAINEAFRNEKKRVEIAPIGDFLHALGDEAAGVDGVLFAYRSIGESERGKLAALRIPYVFISRVIPGENYVSCNYFKSMLSLTRMMIETGHRKIGYLGNAANPNNADRFRGYASAVQESGTMEAFSVSAGSIFDVDENAARPFVERGCDAVLCFNDYMAIRLIKSFQGMGMTVPGDVSVTGFDDSALRRVAVPLLTTVRQPGSDMAFLASRWLRDNILNKSNRRLCIEVEGEIIAGDSVRKRN